MAVNNLQFTIRQFVCYLLLNGRNTNATASVKGGNLSKQSEQFPKNDSMKTSFDFNLIIFFF